MEPDTPKFICPHLTEGVTDIFVWFTGVGKELNWTCGACAKNYPAPPETWLPATEEWLTKNRDKMYWEGICGRPKIRHRTTDLCFSTRDLVLEADGGAFVDARPCIGRPFCWHTLSSAGTLALFSSVNGEVITSCKLEDLGFEITAETGICFAPPP